jgi:hypothetical protein
MSKAKPKRGRIERPEAKRRKAKGAETPARRLRDIQQ